MDIKNWGVAIGGALLVGSLGIVGATAGPAAASTSAATSTTVTAAVVSNHGPGSDAGNMVPGDGHDYRQGYRDGYKDGWQTARSECRRPQRFDHLSNGDRDYVRGYGDGFDKGYGAGFDEYCGSAHAESNGHYPGHHHPHH
jgi:hypothetical protein